MQRFFDSGKKVLWSFLILSVAWFFIAALVASPDDAFPGEPLSGKASGAQMARSDLEITHRLTGKWVGEEKGFWGTLDYRANGVCFSQLQPTNFFLQLVARTYSFSGRWEIKGGILISEVEQSNGPGIKPGTVYRNEILKLTDSIFVTKNERGWITEFKKEGE